MQEIELSIAKLIELAQTLDKAKDCKWQDSPSFKLSNFSIISVFLFGKNCLLYTNS